MKNDKYYVLIVEDDDKIRETLKDYLLLKGYEVLIAKDGKEALDKFYENVHCLELVLLDGMLPYLDGFEVLRYIREQSKIPVIMLTAREEERDYLKGYEYGADVYLTKPFKLSIVEAQMRALIQRYVMGTETVWETEGLTVNFSGQTMSIGGETIVLTKKEFDLLKYFIENKNIVLTREMIINTIWGLDYYGDYRTVDTLVKQLRKKMNGKAECIQSVYGAGYKFEVDS